MKGQFFLNVQVWEGLTEKAKGGGPVSVRVIRKGNGQRIWSKCTMYTWICQVKRVRKVIKIYIGNVGYDVIHFFK